MITIDALHVLLLSELALVLAVTVVVLAIRGKKFRALHQSIAQELEEAYKAQEELRKQLAETATGAPQQPSETTDTAAASSEAAKAHENCKIELSILESKLKEKTTLLNDLQAKFDDLEKEYLILYRQQQKQEAEKPKS
jgi:DNA-binding ferritin-like protein